VLLATLSACGSDSPTSPGRIPSVAGTYSGSTTFVFPELGQSTSCATSTTVTQSGATVNIAPLLLEGACGGLSLPVGQVTIDSTGAILGDNTGSFFEPSCGGTYDVTASGGFVGRELRMSMAAKSQTCLNFNLTINLSR
jgi:hypothetical protein